MAVTSAITATPNPNAAAASTAVASKTMASNFDQFLRLLTTQLKNQNPLDPLDTNQFTQQLVQFAQVEQQISMNQQLTTLIALQQTTQATQAISLVGATVTVGGDTAELRNGIASWSFSPAKTAAATVTIKDATGQTAYTGNFTVNPGQQNFTWDGKGNNGAQWPDGKYTISVVAKDSSGQSVAVSSQVTGVVDSVDVTQNPPLLWVGGNSFTLDQIKQIRRGS
jgi:flagellar basal-body rod modification protein FlgD